METELAQFDHHRADGDSGRSPVFHDVSPKPEEKGSSAFDEFLLEMKRVMSPLPDVEVSLRNASVEVKVTEGKPKREKSLFMIRDVSSTVRPGTMTLILAPPGHGKSAFLKALAGRLPLTEGQLLYNGCDEGELLASGVQVKKLVQYADQTDVHLPLLTVRQTLQFIVDSNTPPSASPEHLELNTRKASAFISMMGLEGCADTIVGDDAVRGVSGGEKKRVTIGEVLLTDARALFLDEITNGPLPLDRILLEYLDIPFFHRYVEPLTARSTV